MGKKEDDKKYRETHKKQLEAYEATPERKSRRKITKKIWRQNNFDKVKEQKRKSRRKERFNHNVRNQTWARFGKLPKDWQYHHPYPYRYDVFICVHKDEHPQIDVKYGKTGEIIT